MVFALGSEWPLPSACSCSLDRYTIPQALLGLETQGVCAGSLMTESTRAGVSVGSYVRGIRDPGIRRLAEHCQSLPDVVGYIVGWSILASM